MKIVKWNGKKITKPGLYAGVPLETYHSQRLFDGPSVSSSGLRRVLEINGGSPAHFYSEWSGNSQRVEPADSKALVLGRAAHHLMLDIPAFSKHFAIRPDHFDSYRTKEAREWRDEKIAKGIAVLTDEDVECIRGMSVSLKQHPLVHAPAYRKGKLIGYHGLLNGEIELSMFWRDKETELWIKARPDSVPTDSGDYADLKTTTSVQYSDLVRTISDYAYHQQAALVAEGSRITAEIEMQSFSFVFVEKKPPYCCRIVQLKDIGLGDKQNHSAMRLIARCIKENKWPGPGDATTVDHVDLSSRYREAAELLIAEEKRAKGAYK